MRLLEIKDGLSVDISKIEAIAKMDDFTTLISTTNSSYEANFPYGVLREILESMEEEEIPQEALKNLDVLAKSAQFVRM